VLSCCLLLCLPSVMGLGLTLLARLNGWLTLVNFLTSAGIFNCRYRSEDAFVVAVAACGDVACRLEIARDQVEVSSVKVLQHANGKERYTESRALSCARMATAWARMQERKRGYQIRGFNLKWQQLRNSHVRAHGQIAACMRLQANGRQPPRLWCNVGQFQRL
jgi:hypothetical protein